MANGAFEHTTHQRQSDATRQQQTDAVPQHITQLLDEYLTTAKNDSLKPNSTADVCRFGLRQLGEPANDTADKYSFDEEYMHTALNSMRQPGSPSTEGNFGVTLPELKIVAEDLSRSKDAGFGLYQLLRNFNGISRGDGVIDNEDIDKWSVQRRNADDIKRMISRRGDSLPEEYQEQRGVLGSSLTKTVNREFLQDAITASTTTSENRSAAKTLLKLFDSISQSDGTIDTTDLIEFYESRAKVGQKIDQAYLQASINCLDSI